MRKVREHGIGVFIFGIFAFLSIAYAVAPVGTVSSQRDRGYLAYSTSHRNDWGGGADVTGKLEASIFNAYTANGRVTGTEFGLYTTGGRVTNAGFSGYTTNRRLTVAEFAAYTSIDRASGGLDTAAFTAYTSIDRVTLATFSGYTASNRNWGDIGGTLSNQTDLQNALNAKQNYITGGATTITGSDLTASRALVSNTLGKVAVSSVTSTELSYLSGVTSGLQAQLTGKVGTSQSFGGDVSGTYNAIIVANDSHDHTSSTIPTNSFSAAGLVPAGAGSASKVWKTDGSGIPGWRDDATGSSPTFDAVGGGTNTTSTMTVGTGGTLTYSGSGVLNASRYKGESGPSATEFAYLSDLESAILEVNDVVNNLTSGGTAVPLSAEQGKNLNTAFINYTTQDRPTSAEVAATYATKTETLRVVEVDSQAELEAAATQAVYVKMVGNITLTSDVTLNNRLLVLDGNGYAFSGNDYAVLIAAAKEVKYATFNRVLLAVKSTGDYVDIHHNTFESLGILTNYDLGVNKAAADALIGVKIHNNILNGVRNLDIANDRYNGTTWKLAPGQMVEAITIVGNNFEVYNNTVNGEYRAAVSTYGDSMYGKSIAYAGYGHDIYNNTLNGNFQLKTGIIAWLDAAEGPSLHDCRVHHNHLYNIVAEAIALEGYGTVSFTVTSVNSGTNTIVGTIHKGGTLTPSDATELFAFAVDGTAAGTLRRVATYSVVSTTVTITINPDDGDMTLTDIQAGDYIGVSPLAYNNTFDHNTVAVTKPKSEITTYINGTPTAKTSPSSYFSNVGISFFCSTYRNKINNNTLEKLNVPINVAALRIKSPTTYPDWGRYTCSIRNTIEGNVADDYDWFNGISRGYPNTEGDAPTGTDPSAYAWHNTVTGNTIKTMTTPGGTGAYDIQQNKELTLTNNFFSITPTYADNTYAEIINLPTIAGGSGCLQTSDGVNVTVGACGGSVGGSDTQIAYNNGGTAGGDATFTFDDTNKSVELTNGTAFSIAASSAYGLRQKNKSLLIEGTGSSGSFGLDGRLILSGTGAFTGYNRMLLYENSYTTSTPPFYRLGRFGGTPATVDTSTTGEIGRYDFSMSYGTTQINPAAALTAELDVIADATPETSLRLKISNGTTNNVEVVKVDKTGLVVANGYKLYGDGSGLTGTTGESGATIAAGGTITCAHTAVEITSGATTDTTLPQNCTVGHKVTIKNISTNPQDIWAGSGLPLDASNSAKWRLPDFGSATFISRGTTAGWTIGSKLPVPDCDNATTNKLLYDETTNTFTCGTDQTGSGISAGDSTASMTDTGTDGAFLVSPDATATMKCISGKCKVGDTGNNPTGVFEVYGVGATSNFTRTSPSTGIGGVANFYHSNTGTDAGDTFGSRISFGFTDSGVTNSLLGGIGFVRDGADTTGAFVVHDNVAGTFTERFRVSNNGKIRISFYTPASASEACTTGDFAIDANYYYLCTTTNTWKRLAVGSTW